MKERSQLSAKPNTLKHNEAKPRISSATKKK
jgi:hypothetical protein